MRRNLDLLSVLFTVTRKNLTEKMTALVPRDWMKGSVVIGRSSYTNTNTNTKSLLLKYHKDI